VIFRRLPLVLNKRIVVTFILIFTTVVIVDSTIVKFTTYSDRSLPSETNFWMFVTFCLIYSFGSSILLNSVKKTGSMSFYKPLLKIRYFYFIIITIQTSILSILLIILLQMIFIQKYSIFLLSAVTYICHLSALLFLIMLVILFIGWLRSKRNYVVLLYTISFALVSTTIVLSLIYL